MVTYGELVYGKSQFREQARKHLVELASLRARQRSRRLGMHLATLLEPQVRKEASEVMLDLECLSQLARAEPRRKSPRREPLLVLGPVSFQLSFC